MVNSFAGKPLAPPGLSRKDCAVICRGLADRRSLHRMSGEVLVKACNHFSHSSLNVPIECRDHCWHIFSADWLIMRVMVRPNRSAGIEIAHLKFQSDSGQYLGATQFLKIIQAATNCKIAFHIAASVIHGTVAARRSHLPQEDSLDQLGRRFGPTLKLIRTELLGTIAVDDAVFAIQMGRH